MKRNSFKKTLASLIIAAAATLSTAHKTVAQVIDYYGYKTDISTDEHLYQFDPLNAWLISDKGDTNQVGAGADFSPNGDLYVIGKLTGGKHTENIHKGICNNCGKEAKTFRNEISKGEHRISGFCQKCQDEVYGVD